jgi:hypothetical protein
MAGHDDDSKSGGDPDRAAILARRQRFVALALSGLATTGCTDGSTKQPGDDKADDKKAAEPPPHPCLSPVQPEQKPPEPPPQPCLKVAPPEPEGESESGGVSEPEPAPEPAPQPCLKKAPPRPCLKVAPSRP